MTRRAQEQGEARAAIARGATREEGAPRRRAARQTMPDLSAYCICGHRARVSHSADLRSKVDRALGQVLRARECAACGRRWRTLELRESEVQELRRLAHLYLMTSARTQCSPPEQA